MVMKSVMQIGRQVIVRMHSAPRILVIKGNTLDCINGLLSLVTVTGQSSWIIRFPTTYLATDLYVGAQREWLKIS